MMKKLMTAVAVMLTAVGVMADPGTVAGSVTIAANKTVFTNVVDFGGANGYKQLEKMVFLNNGAETATIVVAAQDDVGKDRDASVFTTISTLTVTTGANSVTYPTRTANEVTTMTGNTNTMAKIFPYAVGKLRILTTMAASNAPSTIAYSVYAK